MLTREYLKTKLLYNKLTGEFVWRVKPSKGGVKVGDTAGSIFANRTNGKKYITICIDKHKYYGHRLAFLYVDGSFPENEVDHIDGDGLNNKWENLRSVDAFGNKKNIKKHRDNKSGITGVHWETRDSKWVARIVSDRIRYDLGYFDNIFDAACARKNAEIKYNFHPNHGSDRPL